MHIIIIYLGIVLGVFVEGEMIMISAIIAAHHGYLNLWIVILIGITGTYGSDMFYFFLGRKKGVEWLNKKEKFKNKVAVINTKIEKYPVLIFLTYRFLYGFRTITPMVIGASGIKKNTFIFYSAVSTLIWATLYTSAGYLFGEVIKSKLSHIEHIEKYIIGLLVLVAIIIFFVAKYRKSTIRGEIKISDTEI